jgi:hypothetical protein
VPLCPPLHSLASVFQEDSLVAEIADQVERYPERDEILEEKQAQKTHVPYAVNGNGRARCSDNHRAGHKEHHCGNEATYNTGFRLEIACDIKQGSGPLSESDDIGAYIGTEQFKVPPDQRAIRNQGNDTFGAGSGHLIGPGPKKLIASAVGYANATALTRVFTQRVGMSPSEWLARSQGHRK